MGLEMKDNKYKIQYTLHKKQTPRHEQLLSTD